jgi:hypothetical protein
MNWGTVLVIAQVQSKMHIQQNIKKKLSVVFIQINKKRCDP